MSIRLWKSRSISPGLIAAAAHVASARRSASVSIRSLFLVLFATSAATLAGSAARADEAATEPAGASLEEVVVTARKVAESAQDVPVTISSLTGSELQRNVVLNLSDLQQSLTGIAIVPDTQGLSPYIAIRSSSTSGVATYIDDVPMANNTAITNALYDMNSVEVLKGPQGTLFGVNTTGGAVVFRPNKPTDTLEGFVDLNYGNFDRRETTAMINVPVTDVLQIRLAGDLVRRDGTITNLVPAPGIPAELNDLDYNSGRLSVRLKLANVTDDLVADIYQENDTGNQAVPVALDVTNALMIPVLTNANVYGDRTVSLGGNASGVNLPIFNQAHMWGIQDTFVWDISDLSSVKNVIGYRSDDTNTFQNNGGEVIYLVDGHTQNLDKQWTEELTLRLKNADASLRYVAGFFYLHSDIDSGNAYDLAQDVFYGIPPPALGYFPPDAPNSVAELSAAYYQRTAESKAPYMQLEWDFAARFTLTAGARYNWDNLSLINSQHGYSAALGQFPPPDPTGNFYAGPCAAEILMYYQNFNPATCTATASTSSDAPSWNLVLQDKFTDKTMAYLRAAGGYIAGGLNNQIREAEYQSYAPEKVTEGEAGVKSDWKVWDRPIRTNFDVFYGQYRDKQETENGAYADGTQWVANFNAAKTTYYGLDLETTLIVTDQFSLSANWTYVDARFDTFNFPAVGIIPAQNISGATPALTPKNTVNFSATEYWPVPSQLGSLTSTLSGYYRSLTRFTDVTNLGSFPESVAVGPGYHTINLTTDWSHINGSGWTVGIWIRNAFNTTYVIETGPQAALGYASTYFGDPRTFGGHVRYSF